MSLCFFYLNGFTCTYLTYFTSYRHHHCPGLFRNGLSQSSASIRTCPLFYVHKSLLLFLLWTSLPSSSNLSILHLIYSLSLLSTCPNHLSQTLSTKQPCNITLFMPSILVSPKEKLNILNSVFCPLNYRMSLLSSLFCASLISSLPDPPARTSFLTSFPHPPLLPCMCLWG